jgi:hypothetical protein
VALTPPARAEAQEAGLLTGPVSVSGSVNVTTKGISNVPALTLGRPAAIVDLAVRKGRLGFEPQLRFDLEGKPWSFLLWGRYRAVEGDNFRLTLGAHPSFSFRTVRASLVADGVERDLIQVRRYVAGDAASSWRLSETVTTGGYYLYSHGLDFGAAAPRPPPSGRRPPRRSRVNCPRPAGAPR